MPMVKFSPSAEQREVVAALSAAKMPLERIAASIINPRTKRAISEKTLRRMFKDQLDAGVGTIVEAYKGLRAALAEKQPWAIKYTLDHIAEFKAKERDITTPQAVKNEVLQIHVTGVESPYIDEPVPASNDIDLVANPPEPMRQLPRVDAYPMALPEPEPAASQEQPYRTELDLPGAMTPWHKKPITGNLRPAPVMGTKRGGWAG